MNDRKNERRKFLKSYSATFIIQHKDICNLLHTLNAF